MFREIADPILAGTILAVGLIFVLTWTWLPPHFLLP
jgi:hypothetical protein